MLEGDRNLYFGVYKRSSLSSTEWFIVSSCFLEVGDLYFLLKAVSRRLHHPLKGFCVRTIILTASFSVLVPTLNWSKFLFIINYLQVMVFQHLRSLRRKIVYRDRNQHSYMTAQFSLSSIVDDHFKLLFSIYILKHKKENLS